MDPARAKVEEYSNATPISAQPVAAPTYTGQAYAGTTASPHQQGMQPMVVQSTAFSGQYYGPAGQQNPLFVSNGRQYPQGRWGDSICDWPTNMYPSCYCVCCVCCGMYLAAQSKSSILSLPRDLFPV